MSARSPTVKTRGQGCPRSESLGDRVPPRGKACVAARRVPAPAQPNLDAGSPDLRFPARRETLSVQFGMISSAAMKALWTSRQRVPVELHGDGRFVLPRRDFVPAYVKTFEAG